MKTKEAVIKKVKWYKDKRILVYLMGFFIILIMIASVLNIGEKEEKQKYNNYVFTKTERGWLTYVNNQAIMFNYLPQELEDITIPSLNLNSKKVYILIDPEEITIQDYNIQRLIYTLRYLNINTFLACSKETNCPDIPIIDCSNPNFVFYFKLSNETKTYKENNCLILEGNNDGQLMLVERLNYALFGII